MATELPVADVLAILKGIRPDEMTPETVQARLEGVHIEAGSLAPFLHFVKGRYTRNLIYRDDAHFEMLALCWDEATYSPIHDHAGQDCWFLVHEGQFCVEGYRLLEGGTCPGDARIELADEIHRASRGALDHRGPVRDIHRVTVSRGNPRAVSIHVYARPFDDCLVYDLKHHVCRRQRLKYHTIAGRPADPVTLA